MMHGQRNIKKSASYFLKNISISVNTEMPIYSKCEIQLFELSHQNSPKKKSRCI